MMLLSTVQNPVCSSGLLLSPAAPSPSLTPPDWQAVTGVQNSGLHSTVQVPATSERQFFRLKAGN